MKVLIFSDSHTKHQNMAEVMKKVHSDMSAVLFLGDGIDDVRCLEKKYSAVKFHYVCGNCDYGSREEAQKLVHIGGKKIFMTHGHLYNVKLGYERISYAAYEKEADICLFGHTHVPVIYYYSKTLFLNPGSISLPHSGDFPSYGVIDISDTGVINPSVVSKQGGIFKVLDVQL